MRGALWWCPGRALPGMQLPARVWGARGARPLGPEPGGARVSCVWPELPRPAQRGARSPSHMPEATGGGLSSRSAVGGGRSGVCVAWGCCQRAHSGGGQACEGPRWGGVQGEGCKQGRPRAAVGTPGFGLGWVWGGGPRTLRGQVLGHPRGPEAPETLGLGPCPWETPRPTIGPAHPSFGARSCLDPGRLAAGAQGPGRREPPGDPGDPGDPLSGDHSQADGPGARDAVMEGAWPPGRRRAGVWGSGPFLRDRPPIPPLCAPRGQGPAGRGRKRGGRGRAWVWGGPRGAGSARSPTVTK